MPRSNAVSSVRLQVSVDTTTDHILQGMIMLGIHGRNKSEVASWILREWIWHNQERLVGLGIEIRAQRQEGELGRKR